MVWALSSRPIKDGDESNMEARICGVPEHFNLPWELAVADLNEPGHHVSWSPVPEGSGAMAKALKSGVFDIAVMLTASTVKAICDGLEAKVIGTHVPSPLRWGIHVSAASRFQTPDEIEGATYAISREGSGSHLIATLDARERGWDTSALKFETVGTIDGAREALREGRADVFFWEQFMTQPVVDAGEFRRVGVRLPPWPSFVIVARDEWIQQFGEERNTLFNAVDAHAQRLNGDLDGTAKLLSDRFEISESDGRTWIELTDWRCSSSVDADALKRAQAALARMYPGQYTEAVSLAG